MIDRVEVMVLTYQLGEFPDEVPHQLHLLQQQADHNEAGVVAELLHHQVRPVVGGPAEGKYQKRIM